MTTRFIPLAMCVLVSCDLYEFSILNLESYSQVIIIQEGKTMIYETTANKEKIMFKITSNEINIHKPSDIEIITPSSRYRMEDVILKDYITENTNQIILDIGLFTEVK
jgi:hypothetical protein